MLQPQTQKTILDRLLIGTAVVFLIGVTLLYFNNTFVGNAILTPKLTHVSILTAKGSVEIDAEVARTDWKREQGLMYRTYLPRNRGMLFIFPEEVQENFWMKNTKIPLDMIFADANMHINHIVENAQPCLNDPCPLILPRGFFQYMIEVNAGTVKENYIKEGDTIILQ